MIIISVSSLIILYYYVRSFYFNFKFGNTKIENYCTNQDAAVDDNTIYWNSAGVLRSTGFSTDKLRTMKRGGGRSATAGMCVGAEVTRVPRNILRGGGRGGGCQGRQLLQS